MKLEQLLPKLKWDERASLERFCDIDQCSLSYKQDYQDNRTLVVTTNLLLYYDAECKCPASSHYPAFDACLTGTIDVKSTITVTPDKTTVKNEFSTNINPRVDVGNKAFKATLEGVILHALHTQQLQIIGVCVRNMKIKVNPDTYEQLLASDKDFLQDFTKACESLHAEQVSLINDYSN